MSGSGVGPFSGQKKDVWALYNEISKGPALESASLAPTPDITDDALRKRRTAQALQLMAGRGRADSFLGAGDGGAAASRSFLGGR